MKKKIVVCLLASLVMISLESKVEAQEILAESKSNISVTEENATRDRIWNGWEYDLGDYYYYQDGYKITGWRLIDGSWYYFNTHDYKMESNSVCLINGDFYRFSSSGSMIKGWYYDNYKQKYEFYGESGVRYKNAWHHDGYNWYYMDGKSEMVTGYQEINDELYYFSSNGVMNTGWIARYEDDEVKYTYHDDGGKGYKSEWLYENDQWYYFDVWNDMVSGNVTINGKWYYFNQNGTKYSGWMNNAKSGKWYYHGDNGEYREQWLYQKGDWYYFNRVGHMVTGKHYINGEYYTFDKNGVMQ